MKKYNYLILALFLFVACRKPQDMSALKPPPIFTPYPKVNTLIGTWEWYKYKSWSIDYTPQSTGKTWELKLNADSTGSQSGTLFPVVGGVYTVTGNILDVRFTNHRIKYCYYFISYDSLVLDSGSAHDSPIFYLVRK